MRQDVDKRALAPDEINRLWHHGLHEERLFHDRLNYFTLLEMGLLSVCGIMYNKEPSLGFFLPFTVVALLFTLLWMVIQSRHWAYCQHVTARSKRLVPEFQITVDEFSEGSWARSFSVSKLLAQSVPALFAFCWIAFLIWLLVRSDERLAIKSDLTVERIALVVAFLAIAGLFWKLHRIERRIK
jgi:hypothetical protein